MMGLELRTRSSTLVCCDAPPTTAKYLMVNLAETVFPEPDSPLMMTDWFLSSLHTSTQSAEPHPPPPALSPAATPHLVMVRYASSATEKMCGSMSVMS